RPFRTRSQVEGSAKSGRQSRTIPPRDAIEKVRPGQTTYDEVLRLFGPQAKVRERLPSGETRTLVYRGQRMVPHRRRSFGWFATVSHWDVEDHEIQIDFERDLVRDIQARIRRSQLGPGREFTRS